MILEVVQSKWSLTWYDPLGPRMCVLELMNGHVLQTLREQLKVPGPRLEGSELLTSEFLRFRSRLNETSGGLGKIGAVSGSNECLPMYVHGLVAFFFDFPKKWTANSEKQNKLVWP